MNKILVVGAGPVGITCAIELAKRKFDVVLVESGGERFDPIVNGAGAFNQNNEESHAPMDIAMRRQLGGASNIWGGQMRSVRSRGFFGTNLCPFFQMADHFC